MYPSAALVGARRHAAPFAIVLMFTVALWLTLTALATPFDHDESQYIAGAYFSSRLMIFRDFLYLQPPLHAWTFAPIAMLFPGDMVLAMRLATAVTAVATLGALWTAQRMAGISRDSAAIATLLVGTTAAFQFAAAVVRNDMLPALFCTLGMMAALHALSHCRTRGWALSGLFFGLSIATKLSFAPVGMAVGLFVLTQGGRGGVRAGIALAVGALAGMAPMVLIWMLAPDPFFYGVVTFAATGPFAWYAANGASGELSLGEKLYDLLKHLWQGPALAALLLTLGNCYRTRGRARSPGRRLVLWMLAGGLAGAAMPTPSHVQYLMPMLPPLALALGYVLDDARHWRPAWRQAALGLLCLCAVPGLREASAHVAAMARVGSPVVEATGGAYHARDIVRRLSRDDEVVTLSPQQIVDSGLELDPRFATGPFVYRTGWTMTQGQARGLNAITPATLSDLDRDPPDAILVGYEDGTRKLPLRPDDSLTAYARSRAYRLVRMPDGIGRLYVKTARSVLHPRHSPGIGR